MGPAASGRRTPPTRLSSRPTVPGGGAGTKVGPTIVLHVAAIQLGAGAVRRRRPRSENDSNLTWPPPPPSGWRQLTPGAGFLRLLAGLGLFAGGGPKKCCRPGPPPPPPTSKQQAATTCRPPPAIGAAQASPRPARLGRFRCAWRRRRNAANRWACLYGAADRTAASWQPSGRPPDADHRRPMNYYSPHRAGKGRRGRSSLETGAEQLAAGAEWKWKWKWRG